MSKSSYATIATAFSLLIAGCATVSQFSGNPPQDINADLIAQQQSGMSRTTQEDEARFKAVYFDAPNYQRLFNAYAQNESLPTSRTTVPPTYPRGLASVYAIVKVGFIVAEDGTVESARVLQASDSRFSDAAIESVMQWTFFPGLRDGKLDKFAMIVDIKFDGKR